MHRIKRDIWKVAFILVSLLFILVLMVWISTSAADASNSISGLPTPTPAVQAAPTVQPTMTVDATVTALNKEKLQVDIDKEKSDIFWAWTAAATVLSVIGGVLTGLVAATRFFNDRQSERDQRKMDQLQRADEQEKALRNAS